MRPACQPPRRSAPVLCIYLLLLFQCLSVLLASSRPLDDTFFLIHDYECNDHRSVIEALQEAKALKDEELTHFEMRLTEAVSNARHMRVIGTYDYIAPDAPSNSTTGTRATRRRLSDMSWQDRRDQNIAALDLIASGQYHESTTKLHFSKGGRHAADDGSSQSASKMFLEHVGVDVIDNTLLPNNEMLRLSESLPCLALERDAYRYPKALPNDYDPTEQWYLASPPAGIDAVEAWKCFNGHQNGPTVAVVDTGCSMHPDLEKNLCSCGDQSCGSFDAVYGDNPFREVARSLHGTSVSSLIAATTNNGYGMAGVCWSCRIMCIKAANDEGVFTVSSILNSINYILAKNVLISNHSYGGYGSNRAERRGFEALHKAGHLAIIAAGNENCNIDKPSSSDWDACRDPSTGAILGLETPAGYDFPNMINVGATDKKSKRASFSNFGKTKVHIMAPGKSIRVLSNTKYTDPMRYLSGTSFASPITAGAVALVWGQNPRLTAQEVRGIIFDTVTRVPALSEFCKTGGILNVGAAMGVVSSTAKCGIPSTAAVKPPTVDRTRAFDNYASDCNSSSYPFARYPHLSIIIFIVASALNAM